VRDLRLYFAPQDSHTVHSRRPDRTGLVPDCRETMMHKTFLVAGVAATAGVGYAIACWLSKMTEYAERRDAERYTPVERLDRTQQNA